MLNFIWYLLGWLPGCLPLIDEQTCVPCVLLVDGLLYRHYYHKWIFDSHKSHLLYGSKDPGTMWLWQDIYPWPRCTCPLPALTGKCISSGHHWAGSTLTSSIKLSLVYPSLMLASHCWWFFSAEDVDPVGEFHGFKGVVEAQLESVVGIIFYLSHVYKNWMQWYRL